MEKLLSSGRQKAILGRNGPKNPSSSQETYLDSMEETDNKGTKPCETWNRSRKSLEEFCQRKRSLVEFGTIAHESSYQERPFCKIRPVLSPLYGDPLMKRPLRYRTMGAVREGRGNPSPTRSAAQQPMWTLLALELLLLSSGQSAISLPSYREASIPEFLFSWLAR